MLALAPMSNDLAIVTGTSSGIGAAVASALLKKSWRVIGIARRGTVLRDDNFQQLSIDLGNVRDAPEHIEREVGSTLDGHAWHRIALVNNAATTGDLQPMEALRPSDVLQALALNTVLPIWLMGFVVRHARADTLLRIVNVSSGLAVHPHPGVGTYCASKAALRMAGMVLAQELTSPERSSACPHNAAILSYEPGVVDSEMQTSIRTQSAATFPWVGTFVNFKRHGLLVRANIPAGEIVRFLETDHAPPFSEGRLGE
jgi:benzil reductase ((S)-benzoin forming)